MKNPTIFLIITLLLFPQIILAFTVPQITNHGAPQAYFYPQEFDKLVLDITIPSGTDGEDKLLAITFQNQGTAHNLTEISKIILWQDSGEQGFQGMGIDEKIGTCTFFSNEKGWYLDDLEVVIPEQGQRFFVSLEIYRTPTRYKTLQMKIPVLQDLNQNGQFEPEDAGIFLASQNNGPQDNYLLNPYVQTIRTFVIDDLPPKVVITDPLNNTTLSTTTYKILGVGRDQGGSTPQWVKIGIDDTWYDVFPTSDNYATWEYVWQDIQEGTYTLKTQARDWIGNTGISEEITITVEFPKEEPEPEPEPEPVEEPEPEAEAEAEAEVTEEELQAKIEELKEKIRELLAQIIQIIQAQIAGLRAQL